MTTSSTVNCKSYYVQNADNFNLFCAAALAGLCAAGDMEETPKEKIAELAATMAECMMAEFQKRRMGTT